MNKNLKYKVNWKNKKDYKEKNRHYQKVKSRPNSDIFIRNLTKTIQGKTCVVVDGGGTALYSGFQSSYIQKNNNLICSSSISAMGTGLAESIGAAKSEMFKKLICNFTLKL